MSIAPAPESPLEFGPFRLDPAGTRLTRDGQTVALRPKAFELLAMLARRPQQLVTKEALLDGVWGHRFVTEGVVKSIVGELREALGDDPKKPLWIETVPRRGYRFCGQLQAGPPLAPAASTLRSAQGNAPHSLPTTIGRADELVALGGLLDAHRLVTIAGPAGVGKTRLALALAVAQRGLWSDGVWFVELAPLAVDTDVPTLCATLAPLLRLDAAASGDAAALASALRPLKMLLVFDNAEHLVDALAVLVDRLLAESPQVRILVTSQEPLRIADEQTFRLAPLSLPAAADDEDGRRLMDSNAVKLFVECVAARLRGFVLAPHQQKAIARICRSLDGIPLALELAAARVPLLGVNGIADLLLGDDDDSRLQLLVDGARTAAPRQRTLRSAMQWSHGLLDAPQQRVFRRLGVFRGGFCLDAARSVCADDPEDGWAVVDALNALVDKSFLVRSSTGDEPRFRLLESLRAFALERLAEAGEDEPVRDRHLAAMVDHWSRAAECALSDPGLDWIARHSPEIDNLRAALRWAQGSPHGREEALVSLVAHSAMLWFRAGLTSEGRSWCEAARSSAQASGVPTLRAGFELAVATLALYGHAYPVAQALHDALRAGAAFEAAGDPVRAYFGHYLALQLAHRGQLEIERVALLERMSALERPQWSKLLKRLLRNTRGYDLRLAGRSEDYLAFCRTELALCRRIGAVAEGWVAAQGLMLAEHDMGRAEAALVAAREAIDEIRAAGRMRQYPVLVALWATLLAERGEPEQARSALDEAMPVLRSANAPWMAHIALAWLAAHESRHEDSARVLGWHATLQRTGAASGSGGFIARSLRTLVERLQGDLGRAGLERCRDEGQTLGEDGAQRVALGAAG